MVFSVHWAHLMRERYREGVHKSRIVSERQYFGCDHKCLQYHIGATFKGIKINIADS